MWEELIYLIKVLALVHWSILSLKKNSPRMHSWLTLMAETEVLLWYSWLFSGWNLGLLGGTEFRSTLFFDKKIFSVFGNSTCSPSSEIALWILFHIFRSLPCNRTAHYTFSLGLLQYFILACLLILVYVFVCFPSDEICDCLEHGDGDN